MITEVLSMAGGKAGRPKKGAEAGSTATLRVFSDLAEMIGWIVRLDGVSSANLLDPLIRPQISARYETIRKDVDAIKKLEAKYKGDAKAG